jgi:hypothetical protein
MSIEDQVTGAVLRFQPGWNQYREGVILRGGRLTIDYAADRLTDCRRQSREAEDWNIEGFVRFHPGGGIVRGNLLKEIRAGNGPVTSHAPVPFDTGVPKDTLRAEVWFHSFSFIRGSCHAWDSRFGQNYWFDVTGPDPLRPKEPVRYRDGAVPGSPEVVSTLHLAGTKENVFPKPATGPRAGTDLRSSITLSAWVKNIAFAKSVWIDLHVFDAAAGLLSADSYPLGWSESRFLMGEMGDVFRFDGEVYRGSIATPGSVSPRPDARFVQFRLYYEVMGRVFTDAFLHQVDLPEDSAILGRG